MHRLRPIVLRFVGGWLVAAPVLVGLELLARAVAGPPHPVLVAKMPDGSSQLFVHEGDMVRALYQEPFPLPPFPARPTPGRPRVVWLGGSSLHGGSPPPEVSDVVASAMPIESINLAAPGLDTGHIAAMLDDVLSFQPAAAVIYSGHNDLGSAVFYNRYSGLEFIFTAKARAIFGRSRLFGLLEDTIHAHQVFPVPSPSTQRSYVLTEARREAVHDQYAWRLRYIVHRLKTAGVKVVLATVVSDGVAQGMEWSCPQVMHQLGHRWDRGMPLPLDGVSLEAVDRALAEHPSCRDLVWVKARLEAGTDRAAAIAMLDELRDADPFGVRADRWMVAQIRRVAEVEGVALADVNAAFRRAGGGLEPPGWFFDPVHLGEQGIRAAAAVIAPKLAEVLGLPDPGLAMPEATGLDYAGCGLESCDRF